MYMYMVIARFRDMDQNLNNWFKYICDQETSQWQKNEIKNKQNLQ